MPARISSKPSPTSRNPDARVAGKRVVVMGLGRFGGGVGATRWLHRQGARVLVTDLDTADALRDSIDELADCPVDYRLGEHRESDLDDADLVVVSPAVPKNRSPFFRAARARGVAWTTEINLFLERCPARVVGVTGSGGKSTTAAMVDAILRHATKDAPHAGTCYLGGNIGRSLLGDIEGMTPNDTVVLELSSFQLEDLPHIARRPDVAVYVSAWPNHLDRHLTYESYLDCKLNMIRDAAPEIAVVVGVDEPKARSLIESTARANKLRISPARDANPEVELNVPGAHNAHNARCAGAAARSLGIRDADIRAGLASFTGLPHRLQFVRRLAGVDYYDDSKATSTGATLMALRAFHQPVIALIGGQRRDGSQQTLVAALCKCARMVICFGDVGGDVFRDLQPHRRADEAQAFACVSTLEDAVTAAHRAATFGDVVLLSPGFPSYDAFANYERRGRAFASRVAELG